MAIAPKQLPFAPRPIPTEWFSSWLLRVAAANLVSLRELLAGWEARYGRMLTDAPIDYSLPQAAIVALSRFCRVAPDDMRALDLRQRVPYLNPALLLRFQNADLLCPRYSLHRVSLRLMSVVYCRAARNSRALGWEHRWSDWLCSSSNASLGRLSGLPR